MNIEREETKSKTVTNNLSIELHYENCFHLLFIIDILINDL